MTTFYDISHHHPVVNWAEAKRLNPVLISKATEGQTYIDPTLKSFIRGCEQNEIPYYLFCFLLNNGRELEQAKFMVKTCEPLVGKYFRGYCLDVERNNEPANVLKALRYIEGLNKGKVLLYTMYAQYEKEKPVIKAIGKNTAHWEARYGADNGTDTSKANPPHSTANILQFTSKARAPFANGDLDKNKLINITLEWLIGTEENDFPMNKPEPTPIAKPTVKNGTRGANAKLLQMNLNAFGYKLAEDGIIGSKSVKALKDWQKKNGLVSDGIYGAKSYAKMQEILK